MGRKSLENMFNCLVRILLQRSISSASPRRQSGDPYFGDNSECQLSAKHGFRTDCLTSNSGINLDRPMAIGVTTEITRVRSNSVLKGQVRVRPISCLIVDSALARWQLYEYRRQPLATLQNENSRGQDIVQLTPVDHSWRQQARCARCACSEEI